MTARCNRLMALCLLAVCCWLGMSAWSPAFAAAKAPSLLYRFNDPKGDEKGPGTYVYPHSPAFAPGKGLFDLTAFSVLADREYYYFRMDFAQMNNPWGAPEGFSHQRIAIYIDSVPNQGRTETFREGAGVDFAPRSGWEYLIDIKSWNHSRVYHYLDDKRFEGRREVKVRLLKGTKTIEAAVARRLLDEHPETWGFYVLVGSQDGLGPDGFHRVMRQATEWQFGGGTDTFYSPNVLDLLDPQDGLHTQTAMLKSFSITSGRLAVIWPALPPKMLGGLPAKPSLYSVFWDRLTSPFRTFLSEHPWKEYSPVYITGLLAFLLILTLIFFNLYRYSHPE